jgi:HAD superfamily hydrolase (TIGR01509 family)
MTLATTETPPIFRKIAFDAVERARALIFDCDGTLVATLPLYGRAWAHGLRCSGKEMPLGWYFRRAGISEYRLMDEFEAEHKIQLDRPEVVKRMREEFLSRLSTLDEISPIAQIARERKGIVPMAVASGGARAIVTATLEAAQLCPLFDEIVTMDDVTRGKPFPDLFLEAARRLRMNPSDCLVFEDTEEGLLAAQRAGMVAIDVRSLVAPGACDFEKRSFA